MDRREEVTRSGFLFPTLRRVDSSTDVPDTPGSNPSSPGSTASLKGSVAGAVSKFMALAAQARRKYARPRQEAEENPSHRELPSVGSAPLPETASKGGLEASASGRTHTGFWDFTSKTWVPHGDGMLAREASAGAEAGHPGGWEMPEELGAATWTLLRAVAVQFPDSPGEAQRRGVETLVRPGSRSRPLEATRSGRGSGGSGRRRADRATLPPASGVAGWAGSTVR
ncbi:unnamed protein product [Ostreobium quekettii]|uniref:Uncharacterized protein n=1 Tax=Ostreobium quekettii TaxID=121088 RepID=A0A8S1JBT2_9CHLO|nr:unnamed protein product [Ostreobium quekettii]|eukprot:evm.model.scf_1189.1 EVM.evm.TU.scf_1189.1   scf_1189:33515-34192(+)